MTGVYKIESILKPKRCYIGSSINIENRLFSHLNLLSRNIHPNKKLQNHFNKYGVDDINFNVIAICEKDILLKEEQYFIDSYKPWFNLRPIAENNLGLKLSEKTKQKMRKISLSLGLRPPSRLGIKNSEESNRKRREKMLGKNNRESSIYNIWLKKYGEEIARQKLKECGNKISKANSGKHRSEETKQKLRKPHKNPMSEIGRKNIGRASIGRIPWNKGLKMSEELKNKLSKAHKGLPWSEKRRYAYNKKYSKF